MEFELTLKNTTGAELFLDDLGWNLPDGTTTSVLEQFDFGTLASSASLEAAISDGSIVVNDGTTDLSVTDGLNYLRRSNRYYVDEKIETLENQLQPNIDNIQSELDATQSGAGLSSNGAYLPESSSNYITAATSLKDADNKLDAQIKTNTDDISTLSSNLSSEASSRATADSNLQSELDATQSGAGLETDGSYSADTTTNYLSAATSLKDADSKLDAQIKTNTDNITAIQSGPLSNLQSEMDATQAGAGLETDGSYSADTTTNYLSTATSLKNADKKLDYQIALNRADIDTNTDNIQTNANAIATNSTDIATNISNITSNANAIATETTNRINADDAQQEQIDNLKSAVGTQTDGSWSPHSGTNYLDYSTSAKNAREKLDIQIKTNETNLTQEIANRQAGDDLKVNKSGDTMTGDLIMGTHIITTTTDPTSPNELTRKGWVDAQLSAVASGYDPKVESRLATTAELPTSVYDNGTSGVGATLTAYSNGALGTIDGVSPAIDDRIIVKDQSDATQNGIYVVTDLGSSSTPWILTRADDFDEYSDVSGGSVSYCSEGDTNAGFSFIVVWDGHVTIGTDPINFTISSGISISPIQSEIDTIESASGLNADGSWSAHSGTNYLDVSVNAKDARERLDDQIKTNADNIVINAQGILANSNDITTNTADIATIKTLTDNMTIINGVIFGKDTVRNKWIGPLQNYGFGRSRNVQNRYLKLVGDISSNQSGIRIHRSMCITAISVQLKSTASNPTVIEIRKNNDPTVIGSLYINGVVGAFDDSLNVDLTAGDYLQVYVNGGPIRYPFVNVTVAYSESF